MQISTKLFTVAALVVITAGCSTTKLSNLRKGVESAQVYQHGVDAVEAPKAKADTQAMLADLRATPPQAVREAPRHEAYSRHTLNEIEQLFPKLENPTLTMYVYPHLAEREEVPVPGYTTAFSLYSRDHYALPGEVPANHPDHAYRRTLDVDLSPSYAPSDRRYVRSGAIDSE